MKLFYLVVDGKVIKKLKPNRQYYLGRKADNADIVIKGETIGRTHARLNVGKQSITIEDLGSVNGTILDGKQIKQNQLCMLRKGMVAELGQCDHKLTVDYDEVDSDQSLSRSRSRSKELVIKQNAKEKQKIWTMGASLSQQERQKMKQLMGAKDVSDDEGGEQIDVEKRNKELERQFKVAQMYKHRSGGIGF